MANHKDRMQTAQTPLTTGKLADMVSASSKNNKKLHQYTVTNPSTVFIYSSGYHTHHFAQLATLVGIGIFNTGGVSTNVQPTIPIYI
jgi:hypothetical protein